MRNNRWFVIGAGALLVFAGACSSTSGVTVPDAGTGGSAAGGHAGGAAGSPGPAGASGGSSTGGASGAAGARSTGGAGGGGGRPMGGPGGGAAGGSAGRAMGGAGGAGGTAAFIHPGLLINAVDIARIQAKIAAKSDPWLNNYNILANNNLSSTTRAWTTPPAIIGRNAASAYAADRTQCEVDATAAYQTALLYAISGKTAYADYAVKVLNAYAAGVKHFDGVDPERDLEGAILGGLWVEAAELVRYGGTNYTGWAAADVAAFNKWIYDVVYSDQAYNAFGVLVTPIPNGAGARGAFALRTKMAIGIYLDNATIYKEAVDYFFNGQGNGAPQYYIRPSTGQTWEAGRDQNHAQGGLSRLIETAHMAHNQGNGTLYAWGNDALSRASEYIASYNLGNDVPYTPIQPFTTKDSGVYPTISAAGRGTFATIYELPYHYWHDIRGLAMPYTLQAIMAEGTEQFSLQFDNPMFATLCFRQ